ncbi:hypothetical protein H0H92_008233 [Tricholoma furcatifolium]|nr:hypothetical protein H0H92_008233 [Tricholoma furcatifolium]
MNIASVKPKVEDVPVELSSKPLDVISLSSNDDSIPPVSRIFNKRNGATPASRLRLPTDDMADDNFATSAARVPDYSQAFQSLAAEIATSDQVVRSETDLADPAYIEEVGEEESSDYGDALDELSNSAAQNHRKIRQTKVEQPDFATNPEERSMDLF